MEVITDNYKLYQGDCLEVMKTIPSKSINLVLIDPPYNIGKDKWDKWDTVEDYVKFMGKVFLEIQRVLKDNGSFYFFHNDINQVVELLYWIKHNTDFILKNQITWSKFNNWKNANIKEGAGMYRSVLQCYGNQRKYNNSTTEYIYYFTFQDETGLNKIMPDVNNFKSLRDYFKYIQDKTGLNKRQIIDKIGQRADHCFRHSSSQWDLPTEDTYNELIKIFNIDKYEGFKTYKALRQEYEELRYKFNQPLYDFKNTSINEKKELLRPYTTVWEYDRDEAYFKYGHLTPKPIEMLEHIIKTSSNENDLVLDCFAGSGSTGVACLNTNRKFIGIELDKKYFNIAVNRMRDDVNNKNNKVEENKKQRTLF